MLGIISFGQTKPGCCGRIIAAVNTGVRQHNAGTVQPCSAALTGKIRGLFCFHLGNTALVDSRFGRLMEQTQQLPLSMQNLTASALVLQ